MIDLLKHKQNVCKIYIFVLFHLFIWIHSLADLGDNFPKTKFAATRTENIIVLLVQNYGGDTVTYPP